MGLEHFLLLEAISAEINHVSMKLPEVRVTWIAACGEAFLSGLSSRVRRGLEAFFCLQ